MSPRAIDTEEIRSLSASDPELQLVRKCITENTLYKLPSAFKAISSELCVANDIVLRGTRIALPKALRSQAIKVAHEEHAGVTRCKHRLRSKLWWPGIDKDIETHIKSCHPCQVTGSAKSTNAYLFNTTTKWSLGIPCPRHMWSILDCRILTSFD